MYLLVFQYQHRIIEKGYKFSMFANGCCGDISTQFTKQGTGFSEVNRIGSIISDKIFCMIESLKPISFQSILSKEYTLNLKLKKKDSIDIAKQKVEKYTKELAHCLENETDRKKFV